MNLTGKTVVITGADGGIGTVICKKLAEEGAKLALCSNNGEHLEEVVKELKAEYPLLSVVFAGVDVTSEKEVEAFIGKSAEKLGSFDLLLNLAGLSIPTNYTSVEEKAYDVMMDVNVKGALLMSKYFAAHANNPARIINI